MDPHVWRALPLKSLFSFLDTTVPDLCRHFVHVWKHFRLLRSSHDHYFGSLYHSCANYYRVIIISDKSWSVVLYCHSPSNTHATQCNTYPGHQGEHEGCREDRWLDHTSALFGRSTEEQVPAESGRVSGRIDSEADGPWVIENLIVISPTRCLISKKVDGLQPVPLQHFQAQTLVPAFGEHIETDHTPCRRSQTKMKRTLIIQPTPFSVSGEHFHGPMYHLGKSAIED